MRLSSPAWLDTVRHDVKRLRVPYLIVVQQDIVAGPTRLIAPLTLPRPDDVNAIAPSVPVDGVRYRIRMLDITGVSLKRLERRSAREWIRRTRS